MNIKKVRSKHFIVTFTWDIRVIHKIRTSNKFEYFWYSKFIEPEKNYCIFTIKTGNPVYLTSVLKMFRGNDCRVKKLSVVNDALDDVILYCCSNHVNFYDIVVDYSNGFEKYINKSFNMYCLFDDSIFKRK